MKIQVEMTSTEFQEFIQWQEDKETYDRELEEIDRQYIGILRKIGFSVGPDPKKPGKFKITDQEHAEELIDWANDLIKRLEG